MRVGTLSVFLPMFLLQTLFKCIQLSIDVFLCRHSSASVFMISESIWIHQLKFIIFITLVNSDSVVIFDLQLGSLIWRY